MRFLAVLCLLLGLVYGSLAAAPVATLTWPQSFSLGVGEQVEYLIPMTQAGIIAVEAAWTGAPLVVALRSQTGQYLTPATARPAPGATVTHAVPAAALVTLVIRDTRTPSTRLTTVKATQGTVTVDSPPLDAAKVEFALRSLRESRQQAFATLARQRTPLQIQQALQAQVESLNATTQTANQARMTQVRQQVKAEMSRTAPKAPALDPRKIPLTRPPQLAGTPKLLSVTPAQGYPGDTVTVRGEYLLTQEGYNQLWFTLRGLTATAAPLVVQGRIVKQTNLPNNQVELQAVVPNHPDARLNFAGDVGCRFEGFEVVSNTLPFTFLALPAPVITRVTPDTAAPGMVLRVDGANFAQGNVAHFVLPDGKDVTAVTQYFSGTQLLVTVPDYLLAQPAFAQLYVAGTVRNQAVKSDLTAVALQASVPTISRLSVSEGQPGAPVVIYGSGFRAPCEVHFLINPGMDRVATVDAAFSNETQLLVSVPDASGIAAPFRQGHVYVKVGGRASEAKPFTFVPAVEYKVLNLRDTDIANQQANRPAPSTSFVGQIAGTVAAVFNHIFGCNNDSWGYSDSAISAKHLGGTFHGERGDDEWLVNFQLKNNWVVDTIQFEKWCDTDEANAHVVADRRGTASTYVKVHWWDSPCGDAVQYTLSYIVKGPKGTDYK